MAASRYLSAIPTSTRSKRGGRRGGGRKGRRPGQRSTATSHPTGRAALAAVRAWLLKSHGPVCAYCERRFTARVMTLDHVAPRRGQTAYDRRDNLVLACPECNSLKRDMSPMAFLLARRSRAKSLLHYGGHLSPMLIDMARSLVPGEAASPSRPVGDDFDWDSLDDGRSPYRD